MDINTTKKNVEALFTRLDALESSLCKNLSKNTKELEVLSNLIRCHYKPDRSEGTLIHPEEGCLGMENGFDRYDHDSTVADPAPSKNLLKRLKRGYLLQHESDENDPIDHTVNSRSTNFFGMVKREVCPSNACYQSTSPSYYLTDSTLCKIHIIANAYFVPLFI
jgi:hypothetical protein